MYKRLLFTILFCFLSACNIFTAGREAQRSPTPVTGTLLPATSSSAVDETVATLPPQRIPSHTLVSPITTPTLSPLFTWAPTVSLSPTPTWTGTPPTPTQLATPYVIEVLDWELVEAASPELCAGCDPVVTTLEVPRGLSIALVQVFVEGASSARASLTTDLLYAFPEALRCTSQAEDGFCGMIFGQVYGNQLRLSANYSAGGTLKLEYIVTFQSWADYSP